jgi:2-dehydropantoate 2-reductase
MTDAPGGRSYTVVGAGAVGLLYGTRLAAAGHPVRWLVRSGVDELRRHGVEVRGRTLRIDPDDVVVATEGGELSPSDVVLLATKTTANHLLADLLGPACAPGSMVVVLQNGLGAEERVRAEVPDAGPVLGGLCFACAHRSAPGRAEHLDYGTEALAAMLGFLDGRATVDRPPGEQR